MTDLDGLDGEKYEVINKADLFLNERLGVADAGEEAVVASGCEGALANVFFGDEEGSAVGLRSVLRAVGEEGLEALLDEGRDVHDEGGADIGVERGVEDLEGTVRRVLVALGLDPGEAAEKASFVAKSGGGVVVGVAALPVGEDDDARAKTAKDGGELEAIIEGVLDVAVGKVEGFAVSDVEDAGGGVGFGFAISSGATGAGFSLGEVEDSGAPAAGVHCEESASAGLLDVVAVGGYGEDVDEGRSRG